MVTPEVMKVNEFIDELREIIEIFERQREKMQWISLREQTQKLKQTVEEIQDLRKRSEEAIQQTPKEIELKKIRSETKKNVIELPLFEDFLFTQTMLTGIMVGFVIGCCITLR